MPTYKLRKETLNNPIAVEGKTQRNCFKPNAVIRA